jgi:hypothetical protein
MGKIDKRKKNKKQVGGNLILDKKINLQTTLNKILKSTRLIYDAGVNHKSYYNTLLKSSFIK